MGFTIEFEDYYIPIALENTTKEKENVKHFYYGCAVCNGKVVSTKYCPNCKKEVDTKKVYPDGKPEEVGSRDMWDFERVSITDIELERITNWKYIRFKETKKKPKASEIARWKEQMEKIGKSKTLFDLYFDLVCNRQAVKCKVVFNGKVNDGWIFPYLFPNKRKCLVFAVADGNMVSINPSEDYEIQISKVIGISNNDNNPQYPNH